MSTVQPGVLSIRERLADAFVDLARQHRSGCPPGEVSRQIIALRNAAVGELFQAALAGLEPTDAARLSAEVALVAHGGCGRCDVAWFSDLDLMLLCEPSAVGRVPPLAERLFRSVFDVGLVLGYSVRSPQQACQLAADEPLVCTSLMESRLLAGAPELFARFQRLFSRQLRRSGRSLLAAICQAREAERIRYGDTVFLLEPHVKRSRGGLRDLHLLRWLGLARYGTPDLAELEAAGLLTTADRELLERATEFLLWLRHELHFHAGQLNDVLYRAEQVRIAALRAYPPQAGILSVEQFMQEYFQHTNAVSHLVARLEAHALAHDRWARLTTGLFGRRLEGGFRLLGPTGIVASSRAVERMQGNLAAMVRLAKLANQHNVPIAPATWEAVRRASLHLPDALSAEACAEFLSLLRYPYRLAQLLRDLHEVGILERFIPAFGRVRGLLQFNQYHKYTVDEHCLRAVEYATELMGDTSPLGRVYRTIAHKHILHLALLLHDLGKGFLEDHCEIGLRIATETAARLGLDPREAEMLRFLVHKHMLMNHLAFRRDTSDDELVVRFAVQVGSPELLEMLFVLTAADLAAVGPGVWDGWKAEIVTDLFHRAMQQLAAESPATTAEEQLARRRQEVAECLGADGADLWFARELAALPAAYLNSTAPARVAADLRMLRQLPPGGTTAEGQYLPDTHTVQFTVATSEAVTEGIFHRLTGALTSHGLEIRSAQINTFSDGLVLDRFWVRDPDYAGEPPEERLEEVRQALVASLQTPTPQPPTFRSIWQSAHHHPPTPTVLPTRVNFDNSLSADYTILDIFTFDRPGLLYAIARTLFEMGLSVWRAKIGTFLDQVVDVFYVSDMLGQKIEDEARLESICRRLLEVIETGTSAASEERPGGG